MNSTRSGVGGYKRKKSPNGATGISEASRARMDAAHAECQRRTSVSPATPAQAAAAYRDGQAGLAAQKLEVAA